MILLAHPSQVMKNEQVKPKRSTSEPEPLYWPRRSSLQPETNKIALRAHYMGAELGCRGTAPAKRAGGTVLPPAAFAAAPNTKINPCPRKARESGCRGSAPAYSSRRARSSSSRSAGSSSLTGELSAASLAAASSRSIFSIMSAKSGLSRR